MVTSPHPITTSQQSLLWCSLAGTRGFPTTRHAHDPKTCTAQPRRPTQRQHGHSMHNPTTCRKCTQYGCSDNCVSINPCKPSPLAATPAWCSSVPQSGRTLTLLNTTCMLAGSLAAGTAGPFPHRVPPYSLFPGSQHTCSDNKSSWYTGKPNGCLPS